MIRKIIGTIILLAVAALLVLAMRNFPGKVTMEWFTWQITMSVYVFLLIGLVLMTLCFWLWRLYRGMVALPTRFVDWRADRKEQKALNSLKAATLAVQEGRWLQAEKSAKQAARDPHAEGLAALLGAASAHARADTVAANQWLNRLEAHPEFADAKYLQQAQMALDNHTPDVAMTLLNQVSPEVRKTSQKYNQLYINVQAQSNNWEQVHQLANERKAPLTVAQKTEWNKRAVTQLIQDPSKNVDDLRKWYKNMPEAMRDDDEVIQSYIAGLLQRGAYADVRRVIQEAMRARWRPNLLSHYVAAAENDSVTEQLKMCQAWTDQGHHDALLSLTTGQLCVRAQVWGQAKKSFEDSIRTAPSTEAYAGLAQTLRAMGQESAAQTAEQKMGQMKQLAIFNG